MLFEHVCLLLGITLVAGYIAGAPNTLQRPRYKSAVIFGLVIGLIWSVFSFVARSRVVSGIHGPESSLFFGDSWLIDSLLLMTGALAGSLAAAATPDELFLKRWLGRMYDAPKPDDDEDTK